MDRSIWRPPSGVRAPTTRVQLRQLRQDVQRQTDTRLTWDRLAVELEAVGHATTGRRLQGSPSTLPRELSRALQRLQAFVSATGRLPTAPPQLPKLPRSADPLIR